MAAKHAAKATMPGDPAPRPCPAWPTESAFPAPEEVVVAVAVDVAELTIGLAVIADVAEELASPGRGVPVSEA